MSTSNFLRNKTIMLPVKHIQDYSTGLLSDDIRLNIDCCQSRKANGGNIITAKEISLKGSFRFHSEFATGVHLMQQGLIDVSPVITHQFDIQQAVQAFEMAGDRSQSIKTQLRFS